MYITMHPGKSGCDLINILTFDIGLAKLASYVFYYDNKNNTGLTNKMLLPPVLHWLRNGARKQENICLYITVIVLYI